MVCSVGDEKTAATFVGPGWQPRGLPHDLPRLGYGKHDLLPARIILELPPPVRERPFLPRNPLKQRKDPLLVPRPIGSEDQSSVARWGRYTICHDQIFTWLDVTRSVNQV